MIVASVVFVIGMVNLVLGFALAVALERRVVVYLPRWRDRAASLVPEDPDADALPHAVPDVVVEHVPDKWRRMLEQANAEFRTFTEASVHILNLEVSTYRNDLLDIEDLVRSAIAKQNPEAIHDAVQELVALNAEWVTRQRDAVRVIVEKRAELGAYADLGNHLEAVLLEQSPAIEKLCQEISAIDAKSDEEAGEKIIRELTQLVRLTHVLRDSIAEAMVAIWAREDRLESVDRMQRTDPLTGLRNRLGVECQLHKWWREDPERQRLMCIALVDCERLGKTNEFASTRVADRILQALADVLKHQVSRDSGFERVFRHNGHQFLLFFGDAGHSSVTGTVERIRQTVAATLFEYRGKQYSLTVSAGVTALRPEDDMHQLLSRAGLLVTQAKADGGNRTCTDNGPHVGVVPAAKQDVPPRTVKIE